MATSGVNDGNEAVRVRFRLPVSAIPAMPTSTPQKRKRSSGLRAYDDELTKYNNMRYPPAKIAELLCIEHNLDPKICNRTSVEGRLRYIKKNSLKTLAPVNASADLRALDDPASVASICLLLNFIIV